MIIKIWNDEKQEYDVFEYCAAPHMGESVIVNGEYYIIDDVIHDLNDNTIILQLQSTNDIPFGYEI